MVVDGNIITGQACGSAMEFAFELVAALFGSKKVEEINKSLNSTIKCNSKTVCKESGAAVGSPLFFQTKMRSINEILQPAHADTKIRNLYIA